MLVIYFSCWPIHFIFWNNLFNKQSWVFCGLNQCQESDYFSMMSTISALFMGGSCSHFWQFWAYSSPNANEEPILVADSLTSEKSESINFSVIYNSLSETTCSSVHGILQARVLEWVAIPFSRGSYQSRDRTWVFYYLSHQGNPLMQYNKAVEHY